MDAEWHNYIEAKLQIVSYRGYERAGLEAKRDGRKLRATRLLKTAIDKGSKNPLVYQALGEVYADDDKTSEALAAWKKALEIDPFDEKVYARMAFQLKESDKQESTRLRALALELGADDPWANLASDDEGGEATTEPGKKKPGEPPR
jgi:tetratricopeptide (TPR) repeat protein